MPTLCPVCNGISNPAVFCPCGSKMEDYGPVDDYYGPYSPYFNTAFESSVCCHIFSCPVCGMDTRLPVPAQNL